MERTHDDHLPPYLMVENHSDFSSYNHSPETLNLSLNLNQLIPSPSHETHFLWQNQLPQNRIPSSQSRATTVYQTLNPQNPLLQTHLFQNPSSQNHLLVQESHHQHQLPNYHQMNDFGSGLDSGLPINPSFAEPVRMQNHHHHHQLSLEDAFSRVNISAATSNHQFHQLLDENYLTNRGILSAYSQQQHSLNRMRSISAGLGLLRANSNSAIDRYYQNGSNNLAALGQSFSNYSNNNRQNFQRRTPSYDGLNYGHIVRPNPNRLDSSSSQFISRARSINGLDSENSRQLLSPLCYGRQIVQAGKHGNYSSLEQVRGRMAMVARDQDGCRFLQKKVEELIPEQTEMIFLEVKDHLYDLIVDQFANYLVQKLFLACNGVQINQLLLSLVQNGERLKNICIHMHGTRAMQKIIEIINNYPEQKASLVSALGNITVYLAKNHNGHHVIQQCLKCFEVEYTQYLLAEIAQSCIEIARDKSGCCVLQKALDSSYGELKECFITTITANASVLSVDPYGNYVVQYVLQMHIPHAEATILEQLRGQFVNLSMDKFGSNVVEKCLKECNEINAAGIVQELADSPSILRVLQHPFGNYVAQSALEVAPEDLYQYLERVIIFFERELHSHLHGKKVLARTRSGKRNNRVRAINVDY
ncbi:Pumilio domain-containing protein C6G9.14, putative [Ricinus communis]|uniref:Pumilio domain-containing protein C6G9.14, putative n=1 Tax=Ricinus communis TaxID=3988 RepID=B9RY60_RICCO|nr:Pumilio domain-containing protein C6G9.14, putative [Ricinus communis]|eukprot:XP_002518644.1 pumilio homolog 12 [Ricinus communis]